MNASLTEAGLTIAAILGVWQMIRTDLRENRRESTLRRMRVRPGDRGAQEAAQHEPPGSDGRG